VIKRKADGLLPERQLLFASIAEEANINVVLCKFHRRVSCSEAGFQRLQTTEALSRMRTVRWP